VGSSGRACAYFAQLIEKSGGDSLCSCVGLRLGLRKDVASVMQAALKSIGAVQDLNEIEVFLLGFEELDAESADAIESSEVVLALRDHKAIEIGTSARPTSWVSAEDGAERWLGGAERMVPRSER
jgi:hypothetical protein